MYNLETSRSRRILWRLCCALLLLGIISDVSPVQSELNDSVVEIHWLPLAIAELDADTAVFAVSRNANLILVGTREQGVFLSDDAGANWVQPVPLRNLYVRDLWLSADGSVALVATFGGGLWRSADGGSSWSSITQLGTPYHYSVAAWQGGVQNMVFVGTANNGVWKSPNLGESWSPTGLLDSPGAVALAAVSAQVVYAGSVNNGIFKTLNGGDDWDLIEFQDQTVRAIAVDPENSDWLLASALIDGVYQVHRSEDAGESWTLLNDGLENASTLALLITKMGNERYVLAGTVDHGVFRLDEASNTWVPYGLDDRDIYAIASFDGSLYTGAEGGVWLLRPGAHLRWLPVILRSRTATRAQ